MLSVFTPSHNPVFLDECLASLQAQTFGEWEWVVMLNGGARWGPRHPDPRVRIVVDDELKGVGAVKRRACEAARGEILVELDHDDMLASNALQSIHEAFVERPDAGLVYSHCTQTLEDGSRDYSTFNRDYGWEYREATVDGRDLQYAVAFEPTPHNLSYIWFAPNHVRAFTRDAYDRAGGYDPARQVLDDQDLMSRLYQVGYFHRIDDCLYLQRVHAESTQRGEETNALIQAETIALYERYIEPSALAWARRNELLALDLGAADGRPPGYLGIGGQPAERVGIVAAPPTQLPLADGSVGVIRAVDFLQRVTDKVALFNELYRLLAPGGLLLSQTPSTDGRGAFQDPANVTFYNQNSFWYFTEADYQRRVPEIRARFQVSRVVTRHPSEWHRVHDIPYVTANLIALKEPMPRNGGPLLW
ncbi:MAG TPA: glycosyltransferase [Solirubrobacteraceae bacterium]|jgi:SAM-dependent methyltransferase|nr:glycosyltransferase [Solirubrobacteraceae bacterium]